METQKELKNSKTVLKDLVQESKKIRAERGADFFENKKSNEQVSSQILSNEFAEDEILKIRKSHQNLVQLISENDKKIFDQNTPVFSNKKKRSKSIHLYVDEKIEHFLKKESEKSQTHWGLRKNAGLGNLIQKFILNFIELKKREERQLKRVKKVIDEFQVHLVEFKKHSGADLLKAEEANKKMKVLSNDLNILLSLLEFEDGSLVLLLGKDKFDWIDFICRWKLIA